MDAEPPTRQPDDVAGAVVPPRSLGFCAVNGENVYPMSIKEQLHRLVDSLPEDKDLEAIEEMQYRLYVLEAVRKGTGQLDRGEGITTDELKQRLARSFTA